MAQLGYREIDDDVLRATGKPALWYFAILLVLGAGILMAAGLWLYQVKYGMGAANIHQPVDWGVYIANFVFWVGIAHSGTLISAILFLVRAKFRDSVSRATEAMTIIAILTAGLFPMVHLGRFWVLYYLIPYPSQRQLWPNFMSPLVWDVLAISTYLTVSLIFFYVGLIPDLAAFRDKCAASLGPGHGKTRFYRLLSNGWSGAGGAWRHYGRSYLFFAAFATPLVISVHSVVSWDFAMSLLRGWHSTLFAPYFVAGAIHSGLGMALVLLIPMRRVLVLKEIIRLEHLDAVARTMLVTTGIMGYSYVIEPLIAWYSGDKFEMQHQWWRATSPVAPLYWSLFLFNVFIPLLFTVKRFRMNVYWLFWIGAAVVLGMWLERAMIIPTATAHDFMPHNWTAYFPNLIEAGITIGAFCFFFFFYLLFSKTLPVVPVSELKSQIGEEETRGLEVRRMPAPEEEKITAILPVVTGLYKNARSLVRAAQKVLEAGFSRVEFFSPIKVAEMEKLLGQEKSPVRFWTLAGAVSGLIGGFWLAIGTAYVNNMLVGGKFPLSLIPYCIPGFEGFILLGSIGNLIGLLVHTRRYKYTKMPYDPRYSQDTFALVVSSEAPRLNELKELMARTEPVEIRIAD
jgi:molybdopterin-containing oxidoreductase family membrane subunit